MRQGFSKSRPNVDRGRVVGPIAKALGVFEYLIGGGRQGAGLLQTVAQLQGKV